MKEVHKNMEIHDEEEFDLDLKEILLVFWKSRVIIISVTSLFTVGSIIYSLAQPNTYTSESIVVAVNDQGGGRISPGVNALVKMTTGAGLGGGGGGMVAGDKAVTTIESREFFKHLLDNHEFVEKHFIAFEKFDDSSQSSIFDQSIYDDESKAWLDTKPSYLELYNDYGDMVSAEYYFSNGIIQLSVEHESPVFAYDFLTLIIQEVNNLRRKKDLSQSSKALEYLYQEATRNNLSVIQQSISQMITSQLGTQMLAKIKPDYMIQAFDKPFIPIEKSGPARLFITMMGTILGMVLSLSFVIINYFLKENE
jgi:LPS O-antigen subunit length determinant protein (WzzB/FepE family)